MKQNTIKDKRGATAVEFAFVAVPFIWMLLGLIELSLFFTTSSLLAEATNIGARQIRVGQLEGNTDAETAFQQIVCDRAAVFIPCDDIQFQVEQVAGGNYANADMTPIFDEDGNLIGAGYQDGEQSSVMLVRLVYRHPFLTPLIGSVLSDGGSDNTRLIVNTVVMKNEPYDV